MNIKKLNKSRTYKHSHIVKINYIMNLNDMGKKNTTTYLKKNNHISYIVKHTDKTT